MKRDELKPKINSQWRRKANAMRYTVKRVDERGVRLDPKAGIGCCRVALDHFHTAFEPISRVEV